MLLAILVLRCQLLIFPESHPITEDETEEFIQTTIERMYAKDRQRLNALKKPLSSDTKTKPVATVTARNSTMQPNVPTESSPAQPSGNVAQVENNLSDFISSLSVTSQASTMPSGREGTNVGNQAFAGLLNTSLLGSGAPTGVAPMPSTTNPSQLQQQQLLQMQMQMLLNQQFMFQQSMGAFGSAPGLGVMPSLHTMSGYGAGVAANPLNQDNSGLVINPTLGRGSHSSSNIRPPPGGLQKRE